MVYKLAQIPPDIWMTFPLEAEKWLLNERKRQQQEDDKIKKSLALSKSTAIPNDKDTDLPTNIPRKTRGTRSPFRTKPLVIMGKKMEKKMAHSISQFDTLPAGFISFFATKRAFMNILDRFCV
jgi:hypothetical protein